MAGCATGHSERWIERESKAVPPFPTDYLREGMSCGVALGMQRDREKDRGRRSNTDRQTDRQLSQRS